MPQVWPLAQLVFDHLLCIQITSTNEDAVIALTAKYLGVSAKLLARYLHMPGRHPSRYSLNEKRSTEVRLVRRGTMGSSRLPQQDSDFPNLVFFFVKLTREQMSKRMDLLVYMVYQRVFDWLMYKITIQDPSMKTIRCLHEVKGTKLTFLQLPKRMATHRPVSEIIGPKSSLLIVVDPFTMARGVERS